nr:MAG TPA: hypothetical protein [Caudoviricetes sp.]
MVNGWNRLASLRQFCCRFWCYQWRVNERANWWNPCLNLLLFDYHDFSIFLLT